MEQEIFIGNIKGPKGEKGDKGDKGEKGDTGQGFKVRDYFATLEGLASVTNPSAGDAYGVGSGQKYDIYIYSPSQGWVNNGPLQGAKGDTGEKGEKGDKGDTGEKGEKGDKGDAGEDGTPATIMHAEATIDDTTGTPSVSVEMGGTASTRSFIFKFFGLKGEKGDKGDTGDSPTINVNELTPNYEEATEITTLTIGEKLSISFGKIKKAITTLISHLGDTTKHITSDERTAWNNKAATLHASTGTAYGVGNETNYGHLKITDSLTSTATGTAASAKALKSVADTLSGLQTSLTALQDEGSDIQIVKGSYVGTGTYVMAKSSDSVMAQKANKIACPAFPIYVAIKRSPEDFPTVIMPNPETREADFKSYGGNDYSGGLCSCYVKSDNTLIWYTSGNRWHYKANTSTGEVSIAIPTLTDTEKANLGPINQLNWEGETYDYIAICDSSIT